MKNRHCTSHNPIGETIVELAVLLLVIGTVVFTLMTFPKLPETVPTHIGVKGQVDGFGSKRILLAMPIMGLVFYIGLSILQRFPDKFNYPVEVTDNNAEVLHLLGVKLARCIKLFVVLITSFGTCEFIELAKGRYLKFGIAVIAWLVALMMVMVFYYIIKMMRQQE